MEGMNRKRQHEGALFEAFLAVAPKFCGEGLTHWYQHEDEREFPGIIGETVTGRRIGVEIAEWLNEEETQAAKRKERLEQLVIEAIGDQGKNPTRHIRFVWLHPNGRVSPPDVAGFRKQLFACIGECDRRWPNEPHWRIGHKLAGDELAQYPVLSKYLNAIRLWPADGEQWSDNWITFPLLVRAFDQDTMFKPLTEIVGDKISRYGSHGTGFDDLTLLVIYNRAAIYNSPPETLSHTFEDAVEQLQQLIEGNRGPFSRVLLYIALEPGARVLPV